MSCALRSSHSWRSGRLPSSHVRRARTLLVCARPGGAVGARAIPAPVGRTGKGTGPVVEKKSIPNARESVIALNQEVDTKSISRGFAVSSPDRPAVLARSQRERRTDDDRCGRWRERGHIPGSHL